MLVPSANYWNVIHGTRPGEVVKDEEGQQIMRVLGRNMAWMMKLVEHGRGAVEPPAAEKKVHELHPLTLFDPAAQPGSGWYNATGRRSHRTGGLLSFTG